MKKANPIKILFLMLLLVCAMTSITIASPLPRVAVVYTNNANTTYDAELDDCILNNINQNLSSHFEIVKNDTVIKKLADTGLTDLSMAERRDIMDALSGEDFDYVLCLSIEPFQRKEKFTFLPKELK